MKPSTFFSIALAFIVGVSARPAEKLTPTATPTPPSLSLRSFSSLSSLSLTTPTVTIPTSTPTLSVRGLPVPPPPSNDSLDNKPRGTNCGGSKKSACCDKVKGLCNVLVEDRTCPIDSMYCCDFSGNVSNFRLLLDFNLLSLIVWA